MPPLRAARRKAQLGQLHWFAGHASQAHQLLEEARREFLAIRDEGNTSLNLLDALVEVNGFLGDRPELEREAAALLKETAQDKWRNGLSEQIIAAAYCAMGDADHAVPMLDHLLSVDCDNSLTRPMLQQHPIGDRIRNDPRFRALAETPR
jgi:hypothetical protein